MLGTLAQWIACLFVCMALGCSSVERQIRSTSNAEHITGAPFHREVASSAPDANFENQRVRQAGFSDASFVDSTEVKPASVEVVDGDPVITAEAPASGASLEEAVEDAREFVRAALLAAPGFGAGHGPLGHQAVR